MNPWVRGITVRWLFAHCDEGAHVSFPSWTTCMRFSYYFLTLKRHHTFEGFVVTFSGIVRWFHLGAWYWDHGFIVAHGMRNCITPTHGFNCMVLDGSFSL